MRIAYKKLTIYPENRIRLEQINSIIREYQALNYRLTLRQLYYQLVSRGVIENSLPEYAKLSNLLKEGRMAGIVDWDAIEDRLRNISTPLSFEDPKEAIETIFDHWALDRQKGQPEYLEVWVEKDAISNVLSRVTRKYHVPIMVNRGYSSASAMHDAWIRFKNKISEDENRKVTILYLGDHDPSGLDMLRDIETRIAEFYYGKYMYDASLKKKEQIDFDVPYILELMKFEVVPVALTFEQIRQYNPPTNPAKFKDPRAKDYIKRYGKYSWEVDALRPEVLNQILEDAITSRMDLDLYNDIIEEEEDGKKKLKKAASLVNNYKV